MSPIHTVTFDYTALISSQILYFLKIREKKKMSVCGVVGCVWRGHVKTYWGDLTFTQHLLHEDKKLKSRIYII